MRGAVTRRLRLAAAIAAIAAVAGCTSATPPGPEPAPPPPEGTGYFVGAAPDGFGGSVDLLAGDSLTREVQHALGRRPRPDALLPAVGIASLVNDSTEPMPLPIFVALFEGGGALPLTTARAALRPVRTALARRVERRLPDEPRTVPARGTAIVYVVLRGASARAVTSMRMTARPGQPVELSARRR